jgi:hypothetical protein
MKRALVMAVIAATAVFGVTIAEAKIAKGAFVGATTAKDQVNLKVDNKGRVYAFSFQGVALTCTDGDEFETGTGGEKLSSPAGKRYKVSSKRSFKISSHNDDAGNGWDATGKFKPSGNKASGTLKIFANFDTANNPDPNGTVKCTSEEGLKYTVTRK